MNSGPYYNRTKGSCYIEMETTTSCNFSTTGLLEESKQIIDTITWNTGTKNTTGLADEFYENERSKNTGKICYSSAPACIDSVTRTTSWKGQVGLMYPSDFGYATSGGTNISRDVCMNEKNVTKWKSKNASDCYENDWLYFSNIQWTITPYASSAGAHGAFQIFADSKGYNVRFPHDIHPSVYLKTNIKIVNGTGEKENPYMLEINQ